MAHDPMAHEDFEEYVEERSERVTGSRRLLIITLSVGCLALAVSNVLLAMRVGELRRIAGPERPVVASATDAGAAAPQESEASPPAVSIPSQTAPDVSGPVDSPPASAATEPPLAPMPSAPAPLPPVATRSESAAPARPVVSARERAAADLPPRQTLRTHPPDAPTSRTLERQMVPVSSRERLTASWMVQEHGRQDAEVRARAVADFYDAQSPEGKYWRRVLGEIVTARP